MPVGREGQAEAADAAGLEVLVDDEADVVLPELALEPESDEDELEDVLAGVELLEAARESVR